jgi:hypothetical protein
MPRNALEEALEIELGIYQQVSRPLLTRSNSLGVRVIQCPRRFAYGFGSIELEDEFSPVLDIDIKTNGRTVIGR